MLNVDELTEAINDFFGCDAMYYGVDSFALAHHLIKKFNENIGGKGMKGKFKIIVQDLETGELLADAITDAALMFYNGEAGGHEVVFTTEAFDCPVDAALNVLDAAHQGVRRHLKEIIKEQEARFKDE